MSSGTHPANRLYSQAFNLPKSQPVFGYIYDPTATFTAPEGTQTGAWRPAQPTDFAASVNVSGLNLSVSAVRITGSSQVGVTGFTVPLNVHETGTVSVNLAGSAGGNLATYQVNPVTGTITNSVLPVTNVNPVTGILSAGAQVGISGYAGANNVGNDTVSGINGIALYTNNSRKNFFVQNLATGTLYGRFGTSSPTYDRYNFALAGASASGQAGQSAEDQWYKGPVFLSGVGNPWWVAWEI